MCVKLKCFFNKNYIIELSFLSLVKIYYFRNVVKKIDLNWIFERFITGHGNRPTSFDNSRTQGKIQLKNMSTLPLYCRQYIYMI